jgi:penicillin V acylase-like amidase (Ntn superfamily)
MKLTNNPAWSQKLQSLRSYVASALATLDHDDLEEDDCWENLEGDLNSALEFVRQVLAKTKQQGSF